MSRLLPFLVALTSVAQAAQPPTDEEPPPTRVRLHPEMIPIYAVIGLPRDLLDAPVKGLSSIPVFNRVFLPPLLILNSVTSLLCWSFTEDGMGGGFEAWFHCLNFPRKSGTGTPTALRDRPHWKDYFPNLRSLRVITREPVAEP